MPRLEPWALACDRLVVPDCAARIGALSRVELGRVTDPAEDACSRTLDALGRHLATALHQGARRLPARWRREGEDLARALHAAGLQVLSQCLRELHSAMAVEGVPAAADARVFMRLSALRQLHLDAMEAQRTQTESTPTSAAEGAAPP